MSLSFRDILTDAEFQRSVRYEIKTCKAGEIIVMEGEPGRSIYLILKGRAEVYGAIDHFGEEGRMTGISRISENEVIGELSFFDHQPRSASVIASEDCEVAVMDGESLEAFMDARPDLGYWILRDVMNQLIRRMRQITLRSNTITALYFRDCGD